jgi:hypothetical protein
MKPSQAEFLLRLAENNETRGEDVDAEITRLGREHANALLEEWQLLSKAMEINRIGRERFANFMPARQAGQQNIHRTLADQRAAALLPGGKDEATQAQKEQKEQRSAATAAASQRS